MLVDIKRGGFLRKYPEGKSSRPHITSNIVQMDPNDLGVEHR
jgi:hypothetical protein